MRKQNAAMEHFRYLCEIILFPLHRAVSNGSLGSVKRCLAEGYNPNSYEWFGWTPLQLALGGDWKIIDALLVAGADPNGLCRSGDPLICNAASSRKVAAVELLLGAGADPNARDRNGETPLARVVDENKLFGRRIFRSLLAAGADPNAKNKNGDSALAVAVRNFDDGTAKILLEAGADPNAGAPLCEAARLRNFVAVEALLGAGADPNVKNTNGDSPLHFAVRNFGREIVELLLDAGADPNAKGSNGKTPLYEASRARHWSISELLLDAGAEPALKFDDGLSAKTLLKRAFGRMSARGAGLGEAAGVAARLDELELLGALPKASATNRPLAL